MNTGPARRPSRTAHRADLPALPLTTAAAREIGWSPGAVHHGVVTGTVRRMQRGVLVGPSEPTVGTPVTRRASEAETLLVAQAAGRACPRAALSHMPAALAHEMPVYGRLRPCVTVPAGTALRGLAKVHLHRATLLAEDLAERDGFRLTSVARTVCDLAREHGVSSGVVAADHALREGLLTASDLAGCYERGSNWPGRKAMRLAVLLADGRSESPLESLSRMRMIAAGLPRPELQVSLCDVDGRFLGRPDFYWDQFGVIGEADGKLKYLRGSQAWEEQHQRETALERAGLIVVRWGWAELAHFAVVIATLQTMFRRGATPGSADRRWGRIVQRAA